MSEDIHQEPYFLDQAPAQAISHEQAVLASAGYRRLKRIWSIILGAGILVLVIVWGEPIISRVTHYYFFMLWYPANFYVALVGLILVQVATIIRLVKLRPLVLQARKADHFGIMPVDLNVDLIEAARSVSTAGLVLGIISIILVSPLFGVLGLIFSNKGLKRTPLGIKNASAEAGRTCSIIGLSLVVFIIMAGLLSYVSMYYL